MVEPMDELNSADFNAEIFCGPAQSGKTDALIINWLLFSVLADPMDMIVYNPSMAAGRDFSVRRIDRLHRHTKLVGEALRHERDADNKFDKHYKNGMLVTLSWPSSTELAGKPIPRVALTDYDRMPENVDGEGSPFDLANKRTTTFGSFAMTMAESSPSRSLENPRWIRTTEHEAPPTSGILALYNRGDRRRWYWPCPHCNKYFEGEFSMLVWDNLQSDLDSASTVYMGCPKCGAKIESKDKYEMNQWGTWLKDGQAIGADGRKYGKPYRSSIASFWLKGVAASFVSWERLVENYLTANREYDKTGSEEALKKFYNTDLAEVYMPKGIDSDRIPEHLKARSEESLGEKVVPEGVRFLVATVDVQKNMFVVQIHGISPGMPFDMVLIDRFSITKSQRLDDDGEHLWVKPATYLEDWNELITQVMEKDYKLSDDSGRRMAIKQTLCDSGGKAGVTANAYNFYRYLKSINKHGRFHLVKGDPNQAQVRARVTYPDSNSRDKLAIARGDVPVLMLNVNVIKDALVGRLDCVEPGKGMYRFPNWIPDWWYTEMCVEVRTPKGWENPTNSRNEAWDLSVYCIGGCVSQLLLIEKIDWLNPPGWAATWDSNDLIVAPFAENKFAQIPKSDYDFTKFGRKLA
jgi:phage terminase large subunit GpA-like protein